MFLLVGAFPGINGLVMFLLVGAFPSMYEVYIFLLIEVFPDINGLSMEKPLQYVMTLRPDPTWLKESIKVTISNGTDIN